MKKFILIMFLIIILPLNAYATSGNVIITCNNSLYEKESITCSLSGSSDGAVNGVSLNLKSTGNVSISNIVTSSNWSGNASGGTIDLYTDQNITGSFAIATFTLTAGSAGTGTITSSGEYSDENYDLFAVSGSKNISVLAKQNQSSNNNSSKPNTNTKPNSSTNQNATTNTQTNNNKKPSTEVSKPIVSKSSDATLKVLEIIGEDVPLIIEQGVYEYSFEVPESSKTLELNVEASHEKATITLPEDLSLNIGENIIEILVNAEDGTKQIYTLKVTRKEESHSETSLLSFLSIEGYKLNFDSNIYEYNLGDIKSSTLNIDYKTESKNSKVRVIGNQNLGKDDEILIEVTGENGNVTNYIIKVNNTKSKLNVAMIIIELILIASLGTNIFFAFKNRKRY